jgi:exosortase D (VPLPA-CTERM-specific)
MAVQMDLRGLAAPRTDSADAAGVASTAVRVYRFDSVGWLLIGLAALLLAVPFGPAAGWLWRAWTERPEFSHGPVMPLIAAFLVWQQKDKLERLEFRGSWAGPVLVLAAGLLLFVGVLGGAYTLQQYALVVAIGGLTLALTGGAVCRRLIAPLIVLVLMIPQPNFILNNLSAQLQLVSSALGVDVIRALGISVFLEGNVIDLGGYRLQVVEACDGLRYMFPLMAIGLLIGYFYKGALWKRVLVFLASVPITILMNSLRVGSIGYMVEHWGPGMAEGYLHEFQGWSVFMLSAALLIGLTALLNRIGARAGTWRETFGLVFPVPAPAGAAIERRPVPRSFVAAVAVLGLVAIAVALTPERPERSPQRQSFVAFPDALGGWTGRRAPLDADVVDALALDDYLISDYRRAGSGAGVNLYMAYYNSQRDRRVVHSPRACIPGNGWHIESSGTVKLEGSGLAVNRFMITNGDARQLVYYWFDQRGRNITNEYLVKWYLFWDAVTKRRTDGSLVRLITNTDRAETEGAADERLQAFAAVLEPLLPTFVPR